MLVLVQVIPNPKPWSHRWVNCAVPQREWNTSLVTQLSAEYLTNNLLNKVHFEKASRHIPVNAIVIEIAPHGLLHTLLEKSLNKGITNIALTQRDHPACTEWLLTALGRCVYSEYLGIATDNNG
jgi:acyl transferase domain-containing protein